ncbi:zinc carboxypeptidase family protein (macronuclear) [Tetrahymena thermophila SB210]|uniref:Zinc carboxypeptidase family protein n=1 Tax=Tetrahymena thermophila (strain SB210) TaxID=312017 RepID=I7MKG7_TETTS|nr:zinc carboxypeptidase family protein [Tetrahymena thermophila SB210]EAR98396.2 zinc carboxypeptidase family protein [Tetrahymena thermophila SB210]|eukprot:XP_001018641.2 zinc carboxypeptidase family protein [Tetrahymena thermophila SB210]
MHLESSEKDQIQLKQHHLEQQQKTESLYKSNLKDDIQKINISSNIMKDNSSKAPEKDAIKLKAKEEGFLAESSLLLNSESDIKSNQQSHSQSPIRKQFDQSIQRSKVIDNEQQLNQSIIGINNKISTQSKANSLISQKLSEPLPLLEKGKYDVYDLKPKIIINEQKSSSQMQNKRKRKKKVISTQIQNQDQNLSEDQKKQQFLKKQSRYRYVPDHKCVKISDNLERCNICFGTMSSEYYTKFTEDSIKYPYDICYIDYIPTFIKKMDIQIREKVNSYKKFLQLYTLQDMKQYAYYVIDRVSKYSGMEDFLSENKRIPKCLENYDQKVKCRDFDKIMVMGDYENSNIFSCSINKSNDQLMVLLKSDSNTKGCVHWFQFTVVAKEPCTIQFIILNNKRNGQHYKDGMKIAVMEQQEENKIQTQSSKCLQLRQNVVKQNWQRKSENIFYYKSNVDHAFYRQNTDNLTKEQLEKKQQKIQKRGYQTLDFTYTFEKAGQRVVFAHSYAYTFTDLCNFIASIEQNLKEQAQDNYEKEQQVLTQSSQDETIKIRTDDIYYKKKIIANSRLGLPIYQIKIATNKRQGPYRKRKRKVIYIISRQHPGESPSSFVCQGLISYLLSDQESSKFLRQIYIFKIIPMVNPDGVVLGNTRCNLSGFDLNRKWQFPDKKLTPEVYFIKEDIKQTQQKREVMMFCDLHGHSQLTNFFIYGCNKATDGGTTAWTKVRLLPHILAKRTDFFSLQECRFKVTDDRVTTARVTAWQELGIPYSFTVETSFYGYQKMVYDEKLNQSVKQFFHFTVEDLLKIGETIGQSFVEQALTLEQLQFELQLNKGNLNAKQKYLITDLVFNNNKGYDNIIEDNMKSTKGSLYNASNNNTSKNKSEDGQQSFQQSNTVQNCFQSTSSNIIGKQYSGYEEDQLKRKTTATFRSQSLGKQQIQKKGVQTPNMSEKKKQQTQSSQVNRGITINSEDLNSVDTQQIKNKQKRASKNQLNIFTSSNQLDAIQGQLQIDSHNVNSENQFQDIFRPILSQQQILQICPNIEKNWRDYFEKKDLENNFRLIEQGEDPNDLESLDGGSDSEPEDDLYEEDEWPFQINEDDEYEEEDNTKDLQNKKNQQSNDVKKPIQIQRKKIFSVHTYLNPQQQQQRYYYPITKVGQAFDSQQANQNFLPMPSAKTSVEPVALIKKHQKKKQLENQNKSPEYIKPYNNPQQNNGGNYINQIQNRSFEYNQKQQSQYFTLPTQNDIFQYEIVNSIQKQNISFKEQQAALKQKQMLLQQQLAQTDQMSLTQRQNKTYKTSKNSGVREKTQEDDRSNPALKVFNMEQIEGLALTKAVVDKNYKTIIQRKIEQKQLKQQNEKIQIGLLQQSRQKKLQDEYGQEGTYYSEDETIVINSQSQNKSRDRQNNSRINQKNEKIRERNISNSSVNYNQKRADSSNTHNKANQLLEDILFSKPSYHHHNLNNCNVKNENSNKSDCNSFGEQDQIKRSPNIEFRNSYRTNKQVSNKMALNQNQDGQNREIYLQTYIEKDIQLNEEHQKSNNNLFNMLHLDDTDQTDKERRKEYITSIQQRHKQLNNSNSNSAFQNLSHYESSPLRYGYAPEDQYNIDEQSSKNIDSHSSKNLKNKSNILVNQKENGNNPLQMKLKDCEQVNQPQKEFLDLKTSYNKKDYYQIKETNSLNLDKSFHSRKGSRNDFPIKASSRIGRNQYTNTQQFIQNLNSNQQQSQMFPNIQHPNSNNFSAQNELEVQHSILSHLDIRRAKNNTKNLSSDTRNIQLNQNLNNNSFSIGSEYNNNNNKNMNNNNKVIPNIKYNIYANNINKQEKSSLPQQSLSIGVQNNYSSQINNNHQNQIILNLNMFGNNRKIIPADQKIEQPSQNNLSSHNYSQIKTTSQVNIKSQVGSPNLNSPSPLLALNNKQNNKNSITLNQQI